MAKKTASSKADSGSSSEAAGAAAGRPYLVLARKYRPQTFEHLIGQDAMVRTLRNAFATGRIAQGYMLTGVRGVGKTTTARILARALNYVREGGTDEPSIDMTEFGRHCTEIIESRHPDVIEMDAASNTSVENIREVIENARYRPLSARYKVFIIDEVHMLSKNAFNALLKTLEEPPEHVKFIFATTEVRKVPVTVLSRCQRFDLRRIDTTLLTAHFRRIADAEGATADDDALTMIARAAEGSVRDGLSILDQAIAMGEGAVSSAAVRDMLGLADRGRVFDLLRALFDGSTPVALNLFAGLCRDGAEPAQVLADLADAVHVATRLKVAGHEAGGEHLPAEELRLASELAAGLTVAVLSRAYQMLIKGLDDIARAPQAQAAAEMVLIRLAYAADLPPPARIVEALSGHTSPATRSAQSDRHVESVTEPVAEAPPAFTECVFSNFADLLAKASEERDAKFKVELEEFVSLVKFDAKARSIEFFPMAGSPPALAQDIRERLARWTGHRWVVVVTNTPGADPVGVEVRAANDATREELLAHPAVVALVSAFPGATVAGINPIAPAANRRSRDA